MTRLRRVALADVLAGLPELAIAPAHQGAIDLLVAVLGFEDRTTSAIEQIVESGGSARRAAYIRYGANMTDNQANEPRMIEALSAVSSCVEVVDADSTDAVGDLIALLPETDTPNVLFDVSSASNRLTLRVLHGLLQRDLDLAIAYSEAAEYFPTQAEFEARSSEVETSPDVGALSEGIGQVDIAVEHPGQHLDALPHLVLLFPGFSAERARAALSSIDPALLMSTTEGIVWFVGRPHLQADAWRHAALERLHGLAPDTRRITVSTFDYRQALQELDRVYVEHEGTRRMTLVPMGSKLQAVGASLFCYMRPDVSALFATPASYNASRYSRGCKAVWRLDLGATSDLRDALDRVGLLEFED